jgi:hypothetical protein
MMKLNKKPIYAVTTCWYAFPGAASKIRPQPDAATMAVPTLTETRKQTIF